MTMDNDKTPSPQAYEYYGEIVPITGVTIDIDMITVRLNELGIDGWQLVCFTGTMAWFTRPI